MRKLHQKKKKTREIKNTNVKFFDFIERDYHDTASKNIITT
ncbi:hypothetical protein ACW95P_03820 [Candidatus Mycoplasma pogonae]